MAIPEKFSKGKKYILRVRHQGLKLDKGKGKGLRKKQCIEIVYSDDDILTEKSQNFGVEVKLKISTMFAPLKAFYEGGTAGIVFLKISMHRMKKEK